MEFFLVNSIISRTLDIVIVQKNKSLVQKSVEIGEFKRSFEKLSISKIIFRNKITYNYLRLMSINLEFEFLILEEEFNIDELKGMDSLYMITFINILAEHKKLEFKKNKNLEVCFKENNILFTGKLKDLQRYKAIKIVEELGGNVLRNFSEKVNILICGKFKCDRASTKYIKTMKLINEGKKVLILKEEEFLKLETMIGSEIFEKSNSYRSRTSWNNGSCESK
ncbi:MAG: BRCT domain-containing protein [Clostridium sp.]|uniref:BRCT domain-containing protein n=1 Tax=Clostridium sp. TaxID=1506 RepID=UPI003F375080